MERIRLERGEWNYDPDQPLGPEGGFGAVFAGSGQGQDSVAVKRLNITAQDAAHRELRMAEELAGRELPHVIPILDAGLDAVSGRYFVVMARAQKTLQEELCSGKVWEDLDAAKILLQIAEGLSEVHDIVHRDLKPGNILYHQGKWKIADFGIARFVEESTSTRTLKGCLSPPYAAPEQWRFEHSTKATDVYALGCIGYAVLTGSPPFSGPTSEEFRDQHLSAAPPALEGHNRTLRSPLMMMLQKPPHSRPGLGRVKELLRKAVAPSEERSLGGGLAALAQAGAQLAERAAEQEARTQSEAAKRQARARLAEEAFTILGDLVERMFQQLSNAAPTAERESEACIFIGGARLMVEFLLAGGPVPSAAFPQSGWDVIAAAEIKVRQAHPEYIWSASLWYTNLGSGATYRWYEVSYFANPITGPSPPYQPYALADFAAADEAVSPVTGLHQKAFGPEAIDGEDAEQFFDRWAGSLAKAARGELCKPRRLPLQ